MTFITYRSARTRLFFAVVVGVTAQRDNTGNREKCMCIQQADYMK